MPEFDEVKFTVIVPTCCRFAAGLHTHGEALNTGPVERYSGPVYELPERVPTDSTSHSGDPSVS